MATQNKTIPWAFATRITTLATNTTLGTATRHDFAAITIDMPELTRAIRSVKLRVTARDAFTVATTQAFTGWRLGIKLGAVAFDDVDYTTVFTSVRHETLIVERDVTAYFLTNFGAGATQTCQVGVAFSGASASNVNCITAELYITYDYDATAATQLRCVEIPIQGNHVTLLTTDVEIGTTAGTSDAPVNQIPILDGSGTFNPEAGKVFKQIYLRVTATDNAASAVTTSFNLSVKLDSGGTYDARATIVQALTTGAPYRDLIDLTVAPYSITTSAVHALIMKSSLVNTFECISAVLVVVYTFTASGTTRHQYSVRSPLDNERSGAGAQFTMAAAAGDIERYTITLDIQEPGTITFQQSGVVVYDHNPTGSSAAAQSGAPGQSQRFMNHASITRSGPAVWTRRCDHDSTTWALVRGVNRLFYEARGSVAGNVLGFQGYAIINYTADVPAAGLGSGNRSCAYALTSHPAPAAGGSIISAEERLPSIPSTPWKMSGAWLDVGARTTSNVSTASIQAERQTGEDSGDGWYCRVVLPAYGVLCRREMILALTDWVRQSSFRAVGMSALATRRWRLAQTTVQNEWCGTTWLTLHTISFTVAGSVTVGGAAVANGSTVRIYADDGVTAEFVTSVTTTGGTGAFTAQVTDNTRSHFAVYDGGSASTRGWSANGTPGTSTFDITLGVTVGLAIAFAGGAPMQTIKQSTAEDVRFTMRSSTTGALTAGLTVSVTLCKKGQSSHSSISPTITDLGSGRYNMALTASHTDTLGIASFIPTATGAIADPNTVFDVVAVDRNDAAAWGLSRLDLAVGTRAPLATALSNADYTPGRAANLDKLDVAISVVESAIAALPTTVDVAAIASAIAALPNSADIATLAALIATRASQSDVSQVSIEAGATSIDLAGAIRTILSAVAGKRTVTGNDFSYQNVNDTKPVITGTMDGENRTASAVDPTP